MKSPAGETGKRAPAEASRYENPSLSRDAEFVTFTNGFAFCPPCPDGEEIADVFIRSRSSHRTSRISIAADGGRANGDSDYAVVSADGTRVAFVSEASNLVEGDTNGVRDVFVRDIVRHLTIRVSVSSSGRQGNDVSGLPRSIDADDETSTLSLGAPTISGDGRYVAFESQASDLVPNDMNGASDVFVHDLQTGETVAVSVSGEGATANGPSHAPSISTDGEIVAFDSEATDLVTVPRPTRSLTGVFVRDLTRGKTTLASVSSDGEWLPGWSTVPSAVSSDRVLAFINVTPPQGVDDPSPIDHEGGDVYRRDLTHKTTTAVETHGGGYHNTRVALSEDGRLMGYVHLIGGMDPFCYFTPGSGSRDGYLGSCGRSWIAISPDGRYLAFNAALDALSDPKDEELFGGDFGAMIYDRGADRYIAAWTI